MTPLPTLHSLGELITSFRPCKLANRAIDENTKATQELDSTLKDITATINEYFGPPPQRKEDEQK